MVTKKRSDWEVLTDAIRRPRTKEDAKQLLRSIYKKPSIEITDLKEIKELTLLFKLMDPVSESNNQSSWHEEYLIGEQRYTLTTFGDGSIALNRDCTWEEMGL